MWDTFYDSNMRHRNEKYRCNLRVNNGTVMQELYGLRMINLVNEVCRRGLSQAFYFKNSNTSPRMVAGYPVRNGLEWYGDARHLNAVAERVVRAAGVKFFDFERIFQEEGAVCVDRVHPSEFINLRAWKDFFEELTGDGERSRFNPLQIEVFESLMDVSLFSFSPPPPFLSRSRCYDLNKTDRPTPHQTVPQTLQNARDRHVLIVQGARIAAKKESKRTPEEVKLLAKIEEKLGHKIDPTSAWAE